MFLLESVQSYKTERECSLVSNPFYVAHGPPFICSRGHQQVATHARVKMEKRCGRYTYLHSVSYLTLTAGDKGIKCPSVSPKQCRKVTVRGATACHDGDLVISSCHLAPLGGTASRHARLERSQGDTLTDALERRYKVVSCRGKRLAAVVVLLRPEACRSPGLAGTRGASRQVP